MTNRRVFILQSVIGTSALASGVAMAAYVADTAKADAKKFPKHTAARVARLKKAVDEATYGGCIERAVLWSEYYMDGSDVSQMMFDARWC